MKSIHYEKAVFIQMDGYMDILQDLHDTRDEVIIGNIHDLERFLGKLYVVDCVPDFGMELIELKEAFNINLDHNTTRIVFFRD